MEVEQLPEEPVQKKGRHRKKQLYNSILELMEFYFSDSNLMKDRYLSQLIQSDPFVDLSVFLKFNKIRKLTSNIEHIKRATRKSEVLELSEDGTRIRRTLPIQPKENVDECTIYVERLKSDATHDWLISVFSEFGKVAYVSIPKYKQNGVIKGFAFVEFEDVNGAESALKHFESIDCKIPSCIEPEKLCSIATFKGDSDVKKDADAMEAVEEGGENKKRTHSESIGEDGKENESIAKKLKKEEPLEEPTAEEKVADDCNTINSEVKAEENANKKGKKTKNKSNLKEIGIQILSKKEWKRMRNRYLNMQRDNMKQLKIHLNQQKYGSKYMKEKKQVDVPKEEQRKKENPISDFIPGIIVKVELTGPCEDNKKLKNEFKALSSEIKFIDIPHPVGSEEIYIRFSNSENAQSFNSSGTDKGKCQILEGTDEENYWNKIKSCRLLKDKKTQHKQRGRDKLLKKAERQGLQHIRFDNDNE